MATMPQPPAGSSPAPRFVVKICGITRVEDGLAALAAGADWLGFIRWEGSKRWQRAEACAELIAALRAGAGRPFEAVAVYVDAPAEVMEREAERLGLDRIQLHGEESAAVARGLSRPAIKVLRVRDGAALAAAEAYEGVDLLTDTYDAALPGGTGRGYDYEMLRGLVGRRRVIVAGGLTPENVGAVVASLGPWGVDVSSGVETSPGVKDESRMKAFIKAARMGAEEKQR